MRTLILQWWRGVAAGSAAFLLASSIHAAEPDFVPSADLLAAAKKEGKVVLYTANFLDTEQAVAKRFAERFPGMQIEIVRAPTGQLITRIKTEAGGNQLIADVIDISDRVQARGMIDLFAPYAPPNAADYPEMARTADRLWPRSGNAWTITYNSALVTDPPKSWADLVKPEFGKLRLGQTVIASGGAPFNRAMFERKVLGEDYWTKQAALKPSLFPSQAPMVDAMIRGEIAHGAAGDQSRHSADRPGRAAQVVLRSGGRPRHGLLRRASPRARATPMPASCFSTGPCRARARR